MTNFKSFKIGGENGLFIISTGRDVIIGNTQQGEIPLISHQHDNNGITKYIKRLDDRKLFNHKDTIALADRGVFLATTQCQDFHIGTRVKALTFKDGEHSEKIRLYFVVAINKLQIFFKEYLSNATDKLPELSIMLPVNSKGRIDYDYMERYISELEEERISELDSYLKVSGLDNYILTSAEKSALERYNQANVKYRSFKIGGKDGLFSVNSSKRKFNANSIKFDGKYPYVARSSSNNGIRGYINQDEIYLNDAYTISFGQDTATIFYQERAYFTGDKIKIMSYKDKNLTPELACYLLTVMRKAFQNFSWGQSSFNEDILNDVEIQMPVSKTNEIDYDFINTFIRAQYKNSIKDVVDWKNVIIDKTKKLVKREG